MVTQVRFFPASENRKTTLSSMSPYLTLTFLADYGELPTFLARFNAWIDSGKNPDLRTWLDPDYVIFDWSQYPPVLTCGIAAIPLLAAFPAHVNIPVFIVPGFTNAYRLADVNGAHVFMGQMILFFPGIRGVVVSVATPLLVW